MRATLPRVPDASNARSRVPGSSLEPRRTLAAFAVVLIASCWHAAPVLAAPALPATPRIPEEERFHGVVVREDYRWLENEKSPHVQTWSDSENAVTRDVLDQLPDRPAIQRRVEYLSRGRSPSYASVKRAGRYVYALKTEPPLQQPMLVRMESVDAPESEKVIVDPNTMDWTGGVAIDFYVPSLDGSKVAVSMSKGGSESGVVSVVDADLGLVLDDKIVRVQHGTAGGSVAWDLSGKGFFRTRYPDPTERDAADAFFYQQVYYHALGTPADDDRYVFGKDLPKIAEIAVISAANGRRVLIDVRNGDGGQHAFHLIDSTGVVRPITRFEDRAVAGWPGPDGVYLLSMAASPNGTILRLPYGDLTLAHATTVVPATDTAIESFAMGRDLLFVRDMAGGPSQVRVFDRSGASKGRLPLPEVSAVSSMVAGPGDTLLLSIQSFTQPPRWMRAVPGAAALDSTALALDSPADLSDVEVRRVMVTSKDGTQVPLSILIPRGTPIDGSAPALITGYGGYGTSQRPSFTAHRRLWFDHGGIVAVAHVRGGGEFGDAWHLAGNLTKKQNVFDDFAACARYLIDQKYTSATRLACQGGSNGGLLMGAMITQHPELFRAVVSTVGIYDMLRVELSPNGEFNITEFGTVRNPEQFKALYAYSPYHRVKDGGKYPAVLFGTGANDPRVDPMQSRKMTARLQAATASGQPVLLRANRATGHGIGSPWSERNALQADIYAFLFAQLGMKFRTETATP